MLEWAEVELSYDLRVCIVASVTGIRMIGFDTSPPSSALHTNTNSLIAEAGRQLQAYFDRALRRFDLPLDMQGTAFQQRVWQQLLEIPYGETRSYRQVAEAIGSPKAVRAVGAANGSNPIAIVVPCHRVIGSSGNLTGYGGGLPLKRRLLELEGGLSLALGL